MKKWTNTEKDGQILKEMDKYCKKMDKQKKRRTNTEKTENKRKRGKQTEKGLSKKSKRERELQPWPYLWRPLAAASPEFSRIFREG